MSCQESSKLDSIHFEVFTQKIVWEKRKLISNIRTRSGKKVGRSKVRDLLEHNICVCSIKVMARSERVFF